MQKVLYHVSHVPDLKVLEPKVSSHGKAYVYATSNLPLALLFGSYKSMGDFDGTYGVLPDGRPFFYEAYPDAFKRRFVDCSCYIYEVENKGFKENKTSFSAEVVNEHPVQVVKCKKIDNLYEELMKLVKEKKIHFKEYSFEKEYQEKILAHIEDRIIRFNVLDDPTSYTYEFCMYKFRSLMEKLLNKKNIKEENYD